MEGFCAHEVTLHIEFRVTCIPSVAHHKPLISFMIGYYYTWLPLNHDLNAYDSHPKRGPGHQCMALPLNYDANAWDPIFKALDIKPQRKE